MRRKKKAGVSGWYAFSLLLIAFILYIVFTALVGLGLFAVNTYDNEYDNEHVTVKHRTKSYKVHASTKYRE